VFFGLYNDVLAYPNNHASYAPYRKCYSCNTCPSVQTFAG
jgi:hypothetical protein